MELVFDCALWDDVVAAPRLTSTLGFAHVPLRSEAGPPLIKPLPKLIGELNRHLKGWANYFSFGYPAKAYRQINWYVRYRLFRHLKRRSQRPYRFPESESSYRFFQRVGLVTLGAPTAHA